MEHEVTLGRIKVSVIKCMWVYIKRKKECADLRELFGLEPVGLVIKNGRF